MSLENSVILITGAARGLGAAMARGVVSRGARPILVDLDLEKLAAGIPAGRLCEPEEIAHAALYLLENDYMNGRVLEIDGAVRL